MFSLWTDTTVTVLNRWLYPALYLLIKLAASSSRIHNSDQFWKDCCGDNLNAFAKNLSGG